MARCRADRLPRRRATVAPGPAGDAEACDSVGLGDFIGLLGLGVYLPERVMTNDEWAEYVDTSDEWIVARTGIRTRRIAADEESTADLALAAAQAALADGAFEPADIDEIVLATDTPEVFAPDTAAYVQARLGVGHIPCYDLAGSGCAGFVLALDIARSRALADGRRMLVIGVELITRLMNWKDRNTCVLFGDAAGAAVVGRGPDAVEILAATAGTDGTRSDIWGWRLEARVSPSPWSGCGRGFTRTS